MAHDRLNGKAVVVQPIVWPSEGLSLGTLNSRLLPNNPVNRTAEPPSLACLYPPRVASGYFHRWAS